MKNPSRKLLFLFLWLPSLLLAAGRADMTITAHAGAYNTPANTLQSVQASLALRPDLIEIDVRQRPDGSLAISHDAIRSDDEGDDLAQVLEAVAATKKIGINLDIKQMETLPALYRLLRKYRLTKRVYMTGVPDKEWQRAQHDCPGIPYFTDLAPDTLRLADDDYCQWLVSRLKETGSIGVNCHFSHANAALADLLHAEGLQLSVWTVTEPADIARILTIDPDNITTRRPDRVEQMAGLHRIGRGRDFCFLQMADPQLGFNADGSSSLTPAVEQLERAVEMANSLQPPFVICTGDFVHTLLDEAGAEKYSEVMSHLDRRIKVYSLPGNHDIHALTPDDLDFYRRHYGDDRFAFRHKGCAFIGFNTAIIQAGESEMEREQYVWLERELDKARHCRAIFLFAHVPLVSSSMAEADTYNNFPSSLRAKYLELFRSHGAKTMLCGHLHHLLTVQADGVQIFVASAIGYPFDGQDGVALVHVNQATFDYQFVRLEE